MNFQILVNAIQETHNNLQQSALKSVNKLLTIRNWLIGFYIVEFEQKGEDRAKYGEKLLSEIAKSINVKGLSETALKLNRQFYCAYPQISQTLSDELQNSGKQIINIVQMPSAQSTDNNQKNFQVPPERLINRLSFSHFTLLFPLTDPIKRAFYETEFIKGNWSYNELRRQINSYRCIFIEN